MSSDLDKYPGGIIADAMGSTLAKILLSALSLYTAGFYSLLIYECIDYPSDILNMDYRAVFGGAVGILFFSMPIALLAGWGIPVLLFQIYCLHSLLYEYENVLERFLWLFYSQIVSHFIVAVKMGGLLGWELPVGILVIFVPVSTPYAYWLWRKKKEALDILTEE